MDINPISEAALRQALLAQLARGTSDGRVVEELGVEHGSARIDVAVLGQWLQGFEIKSDFDSLDRLARQMHAYHRVFDELTLVTTATFAEQAMALLPRWWGILVAEPGPKLALRELRGALRHERQEAESMAALLWRDEAYAFVMDALGPVVKARAARGELYDVLARNVPLPAIRSRVIETLRGREALKARSLDYTAPVTS